MTTLLQKPQATHEFDVDRVRHDFPILSRPINGKKLVYLDNAATSQKPEAVIGAISRYYEQQNANIHRGVHYLSAQATDAHEAARQAVQRVSGMQLTSGKSFLFCGATEAINLVAHTYGRTHVGEGDEVLITAMEHHSNIVPWQILCEEKRAHLKVAPINDHGEVRLDAFAKLLGPRTKIVAVTHVSNALGTVNPIRHMIELAHAVNVPVLVDGAQAVPHLSVDVRALDCDFYAFSGHKVYGPTGIGVLYGKAALLEAMPPYQTGGEMISSVTFEKTTYNKLPFKFEAGTWILLVPSDFHAALEYLNDLGMNNVAAHEHDLLGQCQEAVAAIPGARLIGTAPERAGAFPFVLEGVHPHDIGTILDQEGIAVRTGHHCAQPVMDRFGIPATARASFALYNTRDDVDTLVQGIRKVKEVFA